MLFVKACVTFIARKAGKVLKGAVLFTNEILTPRESACGAPAPSSTPWTSCSPGADRLLRSVKVPVATSSVAKHSAALGGRWKVRGGAGLSSVPEQIWRSQLRWAPEALVLSRATAAAAAQPVAPGTGAKCHVIGKAGGRGIEFHEAGVGLRGWEMNRSPCSRNTL